MDDLILRTRPKHRILIRNIPPSLNVDGLKALFGRFGRVSEVQWPRNGKVTLAFDRQSEVIAAIQGLHLKNPFRFKIRALIEDHDEKPDFALKMPVKEEKLQQQQQSESEESEAEIEDVEAEFRDGFPLFLPSSLRTRKCGNCGKSASEFRCSKCMRIYCSFRCQKEDFREHSPFCQNPPELEPVVG